MIDPAQIEDAPNLNVDLASFESFCRIYRQRQDAFLLIKQLNHMVIAVQRHRGMSMALLAGSQHFRGNFLTLQKQLERRLASLEVFAAYTGGLLKKRDKDNLHNAWHTIRADWQDDDVIDNFELHSHFIEQLQAMVGHLARLLERPTSVVMKASTNIKRSWEESPATADALNQVDLLCFATRQVPEMVEQVARIRGLATYAAAQGYCDYHHDRKLRYCMSCARSSNEQLRAQAERLERSLAGGLESLSLVKTYELKLMFLLNTVDGDILSGTTITADSQQLFNLATEIIDVYLAVVDEALDVVARWHEQDLESWLGEVPN